MPTASWYVKVIVPLPRPQAQVGGSRRSIGLEKYPMHPYARTSYLGAFLNFLFYRKVD